MKSDRVPTQFAASLLRMVGEQGYDFSAVLRNAGLEFDPLDSDSADWRPEISAMQYTRIYQQTLSLLQDETFGLHPGDVVSPGAFRMMCYCIISCSSLGKAIRRATEFYRTFFDEQAQLYANFSQQHARIGYRDMGYRDMGSHGEHRVDAVDAYGLSIWHRFFGWLTGRPIELERVDFVGDAPANIEKYEKLFACPLYFNQPANLLYFDSEYLKLPLVHTEQSLREFLRTAPYQLLTMTREQHEDSLVTQVRAMIGYDFSQGFPSFETISRALHMSAPTLRRRLKREGASFQQLKDQCRGEAAREYLGRQELSINAVAMQLGFTDPSAFHRSFKKWTGLTPGEYRAANKPQNSTET
ncbi:MAG: AraC family transcriptional regulator [Halieaceae bacterium]